MKEIAIDAEVPVCHEDWHYYMRRWLVNDNWSIHDALLLIAGIYPVDIEISESEVSSPRFGVIEPPVVIRASLLDQDCNARYSDSYERSLVLAGQRLRDVRWQWCLGSHTEEHYSPEYFIQWAISKKIYPCWLGLWDEPVPIADKISSLPAHAVVSTRVKSEPWWIEDPVDARPNGFQEWYTPARYFARQLVKKEPTLIEKRVLLAKKVEKLFEEHSITKRGGKLTHSHTTILKAFSGVKLS